MDEAQAQGAQQPGAETPDASQGQESVGSGLYDLNAVPEHLRSHVEPIFKQWDANVTRKFQEHADYRKQWEPYESLNLHDVDVEELQSLLAFRDLASDEDRFKEWFYEVGTKLQLLEADEAEGGSEEEALMEGLDPEQLEKLIEERVSQRVGPIEQRWQQQEQERRLAEAEKRITSELDELATKHGDFDRDAVCQLALAHDGPDALQKGFADYQRLIGAAEKGFFEKKTQQPEAPVQGGQTASAVKPVTTFAEAKEAARAMVRQANST
jgi:hypothetical protein